MKTAFDKMLKPALGKLQKLLPGFGGNFSIGLDMGPDRLIRHVYFPETGVLSQLQQMHNGSTVEVSLVGSDGMAGLAVYLGAVTFPMEVICSAPDPGK